MRAQLLVCVTSICLCVDVPRSVAQPVDTKLVRFELQHVESIRPSDTLATVNGQPLRAEDVFVFLGPKLGDWWEDQPLVYARSKEGKVELDRLFTDAIEDLVIEQRFEKHFKEVDRKKNQSITVKLRATLEKQLPNIVDIAENEYSLTEWLKGNVNRRETLTRAVARKLQAGAYVGMILMAYATDPRHEAELRKYHQSHTESFHTVTQVTWQQITVRRNTRQTDQEYRDAATEIQNKLVTSKLQFVSESQFDEVAKLHSQDEYKSLGGRRTSNQPESIETESVRQILLTDEMNRIRGLRLADATMFIRILDRHDEPSSFEYAKDRIEEHYVEKNKQRYRQQLFEEWQSSAQISFPTHPKTPKNLD